MGLADATDIFELCIHQLLQDLQGVLNITDDILVFGRTKEEFKLQCDFIFRQMCQGRHPSQSRQGAN